MAHNMVYYIAYCNFQFTVIHCRSIIHLKYYIEYIAECELTLLLLIAIFDKISNNNFVLGDAGFVVNLFTQNIIKHPILHTFWPIILVAHTFVSGDGSKCSGIIISFL